MTSTQAISWPWRLGALLAFIGLPLILVTALALNLLRAWDLDGLAARQEEALARLEERMARPGAQQNALGDVSLIYVPGASSTLAAAGLQQLLVERIGRISGQLIEAQEIQEAAEQTEGDAVVRVTLDTDNDGLLELLYDLETGLPLLSIGQIGIRELPAAAEGDGSPRLRVDLVVRGHWRPAEG